MLNNPLGARDPLGLYCYYGDTTPGSPDWTDDSQYDFHSGTGECHETGGVWFDDPHESVEVTATPMDAPNSTLQSIEDWWDAFKVIDAQPIAVRLNQCAQGLTNDVYNKALGKNKYVQAVAGNSISALTELATGPDRKGAATSMAVSGPQEPNAVSLAVQATGKAIGQIPTGVRGDAVVSLGEIGGKQRFGTLIGYTSQRLKDLPQFGKALSTAGSVLDGKLLLDGVIYVEAETVCAVQY